MITRVRRGLVQDVGRGSAQLHPLALEADVRDPGDVLVAVAKVVGEEERQPAHLAEEGALDRQLLDVRGSRQLKGLRGLGFLGGGKVDLFAVDEDFEGFGRGRGVGGAEGDGVELDLAGEAG